MIFEKQIVDMYKGMMHARCDDTETVFYFSPKAAISPQETFMQT